MPKNRKRCFVIMPFSKTSDEHTEEYWTNHFESFLKPLAEESKELKAYRSEPLRGDVLRKIITDLVVSPVVVADLTDRNPNVFWELGVRQSFKHCTVTIAEKGTKIPFDVSVKGILFYYPKDHIKNAKFVKRFKKALTDCLLHPDSPDSHVLETVSGRGTLFEIIHRDEATRRVEALISEIKYNRKLIDRIFKNIEKAIETERFRYPAVELLITQRYLDEESSFYNYAEGYFSDLLGLNEQLSVWEQFEESTKEWLKENKSKWYEDFKRYNGKIIAAQKKLTAVS